jgi:hypothetical protein
MTLRKMRALAMLMVMPVMMAMVNTSASSARPAWDYFLFGTEDLMHAGYDLAAIAVCWAFGPAGGAACGVMWVL